ncbi:Fe(3+)-hydroxamate ABC transporter permease FhuB [Aureimonas sp. OT7]|uniref:Fe(3+)-hydroxamate ABC transporter permease FhuB n=1 Tax=Aureimonas TaxID=414371 RepID=UPI00177B91A4|nr:MULTISPECIES: Fe(3+)-hydroxamate ABC transporter permease FhuB [Aureimonas]QOG05218.1 Fe(3+)-hydroxamate ABC transporter permease FhuB [Aureimonas sp. OT7]
MTHGRDDTRLTPIPWLAAGALALALFLLEAVPAWRAAQAGGFAAILFHATVLPRGAIALLAGAALGLSGLLLQRVLRNPIADPSTLGVAAGAQLALTLATLYLPAALATGREAVAFAGGSLMLALIVALNWRRKLEPVGTVLSGLLLSLVVASLSAALTLANGDYVMSLFIWGGGTLSQESWLPSITLGIRLAVGVVLAFLMLRPLTVLGLAEESARSLGVGVGATRLAALALAVFLASSVTALVGIVGFIGLAAPALARACGARTLRQQLLLSPLAGALFLSIADGLVLAMTTGGRDLLPTGAFTALIGGPILLWALPRLRLGLQPAETGMERRRSPHPQALLAILALVLLAVVVVSLCVGRTGTGWAFATGNALLELLPFRAPRLGVAAGSGALLALAGYLLQRITGNPMASPEVLGISSGAGLGLAAVLVTVDMPSPSLRFAATLAGSALALLAILYFAARNAGGPERLLLAGIALGSCAGAAVTAVISDGGPEAMQMLEWLSGAIQSSTPTQGIAAVASAVLLLLPLPFIARWLAILPLGRAGATALGMPAGRATGSMLVLAALASAAATLHVGPLSFAGLIGPHIARRMGFSRPLQEAAAAVMIGAIMLAGADWLARMVGFPYQMPVGLFASLIGGVYLVALISRR